MSKRVIVIGAGGHGRSVVEAAQLSGQFDVVGFLDDSLPAGYDVLRSQVLSPVYGMDKHLADFDCVIVAIGNNIVRQKLMEQLASAGFAWATVIHPRAIVSPKCGVGRSVCRDGRRCCGHRSPPGHGCNSELRRCGGPLCHRRRLWPLGRERQHGGGTVLGRGAWMQAGTG